MAGHCEHGKILRGFSERLTGYDRVLCLNTVASFKRVRRIAKSNYWLRHACLSVRPPTWNSSAPTGRMLVKFEVLLFLENLSRKFKFLLKSYKNDDLCTCTILPR